MDSIQKRHFITQTNIYRCYSVVRLHIMTMRRRSLTMCEATSGLHTNGLEWRIFWCQLGSWKSKQQLHVSTIMRCYFMIDGHGWVDVFRWMGMWRSATYRLSRLLVEVRIGKSCIWLAPRSILAHRSHVELHDSHSKAWASCSASNRRTTLTDYGSCNVVMYYKGVTLNYDHLRARYQAVKPIRRTPDCGTYRECRSVRFWKAVAPTNDRGLS